MWFQSVLFAVTMERKYSPSDSAFLKEWSHILDLIRENFQNTFWNARAGYLADYVDNAGQHLEVRPNMLYALVGEDIPVEPEIARRVLQVIDNELVTRRESARFPLVIPNIRESMRGRRQTGIWPTTTVAALHPSLDRTARSASR